MQVVTLRLGLGADDVTVRTAWETLAAGGPLSAAELVIIRDERTLAWLEGMGQA